MRGHILETKTKTTRITKPSKLEVKGLEIKIRMLNSTRHYTGIRMAPNKDWLTLHDIIQGIRMASKTGALICVWGFWNCKRYYQKRHGKTQRHVDAVPRDGALIPNMSEMNCRASLGGTLPQDSNRLSSHNEKVGQNAS